MKLTREYNLGIIEYLRANRIKFTDDSGVLLIDRTAMVRSSDLDENESYRYVLDRIREVCSGAAYVCWGARTDEWLAVEVYRRD